MHGNQQEENFDSGSIAGLLDVVLGCTLIFMLMTALVNAEKGSGQEITLPPMHLTDAADTVPGSHRIRRLTLSIKMDGSRVRIWLENTPTSMHQLTEELRRRCGNGPVQAALRREPDVPCAAEDALILACREAGIQHVALVVQNSRKQ